MGDVNISLSSTADGLAVSPSTLSPEWSRVGRLLIMSGLSVLGSVGNVYMISAVIVEEHLSRRGKSFSHFERRLLRKFSCDLEKIFMKIV